MRIGNRTSRERLTTDDKQMLLKRFPDIELSYDNILHKKVYADLYMVQPKGARAFLWFTYFKDKNVCIVLELNKKGNIKSLEIYPACFDTVLSYGTLLLGTFFDIDNKYYFAAEDVFVYKGDNVSSKLLHDKLAILKNMFNKHIQQQSYGKTFVTLGLPCWCPNYKTAMQQINTLPYAVYGIKAFNTRNKQKQLCGLYHVKGKVCTEAIFNVRATIRSDIYHLFCYEPRNSNKLDYYATAAVPSYKRSVVLNDIFRTVKENSNLDLLEESDDEEEFENVSEDKFVHLGKTVTMKCVYHRRFRKWEPVEIVEQKCKLITKSEAMYMEKKSVI